MTANQKRILITGGSGSLGSALVRRFKHDNNLVYAPSHKEMDVTVPDAVFECFQEFDPQYVIHAAACIDARKCETDWYDAQRINVGGTYNISSACEVCQSKLVHISTACVFDGEHAPFSEMSRPAPKSWYHLTKFAAEQVVMAMGSNMYPPLIIRTNFVDRAPWKYPKAFTDRYGTYLFADDVAYGISQHLEKIGIVHICGDKRMSMFELAKLVSPDVLPMMMEEYNGPAICRDMSLISARVAPLKIGDWCGLK